jgi:hypothetical protein
MTYLLIAEGCAVPVRRTGRITQEEMAGVVGGPIETLPIPGETGPRRLALVVSELGPVGGAPLNFWLRTFTTPVFGSALVVVLEERGREVDFVPLGPADLDRVALAPAGDLGLRLAVSRGGA